jgi:hypothetical protein
MVFTRPDIAFVLGNVSLFMSDLAKHYGHALNNILRCIKSTIKQKRHFPGGAYDHMVVSDADWASDKSDRRSISGSVATFYGGSIS